MSTAMLSGNKRIYNLSIFVVWAALLISMAFSHRITSSIAVILMPVLVLLSPNRLSLFKQSFSDPLFLSCLCFLAINALGMGYTTDINQNIKETTAKAGIVAIPFFFCANACKLNINLRWLILLFTLSLVFATLYCFGYAYFQFRQHHDISVFFYHTLLTPIGEHAVYYSFYLLFCMLYWLEGGLAQWQQTKTKWLIQVILIYFFLVIILLSSKMVLGLLALYIAGTILSIIKRTTNKKLLLLVIVSAATILILLWSTDNPVKKRFADLAEGSSTLFQQQKFDQSTYFNGLQFRLLTWRFTTEILNEQNAWLLGVSAGNGKSALQHKYIETGMYQGDGKNDKGYLQYDCHNIYLQTSLESGLAGLITLLFMIGFLLLKLTQRRKKAALVFFLFLLAFGFTESYLSRQYGIVLFSFFPLLLLSEKKHSNTEALK